MTKATTDIRSLARAQTKLAVRTLTGICGSEAAPAAARVQAAAHLLDRGWGRPAQMVTGSDGGDIRVIIRQIVDIAGQSVSEPVLIERPDARVVAKSPLPRN